MRAPGPEATAGRTFDLLVVGGGIHGAWTALDASLRGLSVLLVEMNDWGWGTSAKSSKLAHGGLRYLEQLELGLVHEALQERERLLAAAPHLVRPLKFLYPIYPDVAGRRTVRLGLAVYDLLSHGRSLPGHRSVGPQEAAALVPGLEQRGLQGGATFYDAQFQSVERLVTELVWAARRAGAVCLNHTKVLQLHVEDAAVAGARLGTDAGSWDVRARLTVNATGPWSDRLMFGTRARAPMRYTKGIHLVVPRFTQTALIVKAASDGRTFFVLPWRDQCLIGTTDTDHDGDPATAAAHEDDVAYLLKAARRYLPRAPLDRVDYTYAGVRALIAEPGSESQVTRRHRIEDHSKDGLSGLLSLEGGKLTTARRFAEQVVDHACRRLGRRDVARRRPTRDWTLPGAPHVPWGEFRLAAMAAAQRELGMPERLAAGLVDAHGALWRQVAHCDPRPGALGQPDPGRPVAYAQASWAVLQEQAVTLADIMLRRTPLGLAADGNPEAAAKVAQWVAPLLGWDPPRQQQELRAHAAECAVLRVPGGPIARELAHNA